MQLRSTLLTLSAALVCGLTANAQSWGFSNIGHWANDISVSDEGSVWMVGLAGDDPMWMDVTSNYVAKIDGSGEKLFGLTPDLVSDYATAYNALPTDDGGAIIYASGDLYAPMLYKLSSTGIVEWESVVGTDGYFYGGIAAMLNDGRIIIGGLTDFEHTFYEVSNTGDLLSSWTIAPDTGAAWGWSYYDYKEGGIVATADGGFAYATGGEDKRLLYKYDSDLNLEWTGDYPYAMEWEYAMWNCLETTADGGFLFAGSSADGGNYHGTLRKIDADGNELWFSTYNHGYYGEEGAWAVELGSGDIMVWSQDAGDQSTHGWLTDGATGAEIGSVFIPVMGAVGGFSETGVEVWDVEPAADGGYYLAGRMFLENFDQRVFVIKSNADGTFEPCLFDCVWPGDANNDGFATGDDLFEIGINFGADGASRDDMTIDWSPKLAQMWMEEDSVFWYIFNDLKFTDCDGNGIINDDDTTAVINNLGLEHPLNPARMGAGDVPLYLDPVDDYLHVGLNEIPIMLGDEVNSVDEIYGLTFTISVDGESIDAASLHIDWEDSWIGNVGETLRLSKNFGDEMQVVGSIARKTRTNTSGDGQVGTLQIVVVDNISGKVDFTDVEISFSYANAIMLNREVIPLAPETLEISAEDGAGITTDNETMVSAYPNPATENIFFNFASSAIPEQIRITDMTGRTVIELLSADEWINGVSVESLPAGNYMIEYNFGKFLLTEQLAKQ